MVKTTWRDPDDTKPDASRRPREITGWRTYCPLRRMMTIAGTSITTEHILAADRLRQAADAVCFGYSGPRELVTIQALTYGPKSGPGQAALRSVQAWPVYRRAMKLFCPLQRQMIASILLANQTVNKWTTTRRELGLPVSAAVEMGKLIAILDVLTEHFATEVEQDLQHGVEV